MGGSITYISVKIFWAGNHNCFGMISIVATGGGGSGDGGGTGGGDTLTGIFVDSPVEGINFETSTQNEITDPQGMFT